MKVVYEVVEHDGGWAYRMDGVYSETFRTHDQARRAAEVAAREQRVPEEVERAIEFEDEKGRWVEELEDGHDRPDTEVDG
jgi:hypothetical protein